MALAAMEWLQMCKDASFYNVVVSLKASNTVVMINAYRELARLMQEDGTWRLSPAYDITYIIDVGGYLPNEDHCMYIRAKLRNITYDDVIQFARDNGIRRPDAIIHDVVESLTQFRSVAIKYGVVNEWIGRVEAAIVNHLKDWRT